MVLKISALDLLATENAIPFIELEFHKKTVFRIFQESRENLEECFQVITLPKPDNPTPLYSIICFGLDSTIDEVALRRRKLGSKLEFETEYTHLKI